MTQRAGRQTSQRARDYQAVAAFRTALRRFQHVSDQVARHNGLTSRRYELLLMVAAAPRDQPASTSDVAERLYLQLHTVTELVARAEQAGLLHRSTDPEDRRVNRLALTTEGRRRLNATLDALRPERERVTQLLADLYEQAAALAAT